ncbi:MAG: sodium:proton antiporter [Phycisphaeraceae bacterium]|nr:sodium:proton antiporter [Phycisphaeraceae bacterium]
MKKVLLYSVLLCLGLAGSQMMGLLGPAAEGASLVVKLLTMAALSFIMIHVGLEFDIDKKHVGKYAVDYGVAAAAAAFPWVFCTLYFIFVMSPAELWSSMANWSDALLQSRFSSPTSAGVLFSMLAAAGLASTWVFQKARVLAIFDDLDTVLLMIPLKMMMVGPRWQLGAVVVVMFIGLALAWRYLHAWRIPTSWRWVIGYSVLITLAAEGIYLTSKVIDDVVPIHLEVLLPAFVLGCMMVRPAGHDDAHGHGDSGEQRATTIISALFMVLVGLSMPAIAGGNAVPPETLARYGESLTQAVQTKYAFPGWGWIAFHVAAITLLSNLGKMFSLFCYRKEASFRERLAISVAMFPRGEVGAGVLVISIGYGIGGPALTVAMLSLALNLLATGLFILIVKQLIAQVPPRDGSTTHGVACATQPR